MFGATALAPFIPGFAAKTAASKGGLSASKALWSGIYANSGSMNEFVGVARTMGLSNSAIQGVGARSIGIRVALAASLEKAGAASIRKMRPALSTGNSKMDTRRLLQSWFDREVEQDSENLLASENGSLEEEAASSMAAEQIDDEISQVAPDTRK